MHFGKSWLTSYLILILIDICIAKIPSLMSLLSKYVEIIHFKDTKDGKDSISEIVYHVII
jgi:hypothetical protein